MKIVLNSGRKTSSQLSKFFLRVQAMFTSKLNFWKTWKLCSSFLCFEWFSFIFRWIFLSSLFKTALYVPEDIFEEKFWVWEFVFQFFNRFRIWAINIRTWGDNRSAAMSELHSFRQRNKLTEKRFWKNVQSLNNFRTSWLIAPDIQWQFSKVSSKLNFCVQRNILDQKITFKQKALRSVFGHWAKAISDFWLEGFGHDFQNCNYVSTATSSSKTFSSEKVYFFPNLFPFYADFFQFFLRKFDGRVDKNAF